jgi:hypothetical protein
MHTIYKAKFRANGVTYYINTRNEAKRDAAVDFHRSAGIEVETYQTEVEDAPASDYVPTVNVDAAPTAPAENVTGGGASATNVAESPF